MSLLVDKLQSLSVIFWADEAQTTTALQKLFNVIGPRYKDRNGGYTRVLKLGNRRGDNAPIALVAFVQD